MGFAHAGSFIKKSSPGEFLWSVLHVTQPQPLLAPAFTPHLGTISRLNGRLLYTPTHNAQDLAEKYSSYNTPLYNCVNIYLRYNGSFVFYILLHYDHKIQCILVVLI